MYFLKLLNAFFLKTFFVGVFFFCFLLCLQAQNAGDNSLVLADNIFQNIYNYYAVKGTKLLRENYPYNEKYTPDYLASYPETKVPNKFAYLWPYSGTFSATIALLNVSGQKKYRKILEQQVLPGLEKYFDDKRRPAAYASYINTADPSDRFYDDNIWLGIDFTDLYTITHNKKYLAKAKQIWTFVWSGHDEKLGGGIYWCEQKKQSKNTCSNALAAVFALKLFAAAKDSSYFKQGLGLYHWTKKNLQDSSDYLYFDNISLKGRVDKRKYPYNSGQMLQAAALLFQFTKDSCYYKEAERLAASAIKYFIIKLWDELALFQSGHIWFNAVMLRGYNEWYKINGDASYLIQFNEVLQNCIAGLQDADGLFLKAGQKTSRTKWLLDQAAFCEIFARMSILKQPAVY
ncbi:MAG: glycoside hydrolase family 76 protein [Niabella sp.]